MYETSYMPRLTVGPSIPRLRSGGVIRSHVTKWSQPRGPKAGVPRTGAFKSLVARLLLPARIDVALTNPPFAVRGMRTV